MNISQIEYIFPDLDTMAAEQTVILGQKQNECF